jgi:STE24 endopeptidase
MHVYAILYTGVMLVGILLRLWLSERQKAAVSANRDAVPAPFAERVSLADHQKAADYTLAIIRLGRVSLLVDSAVTFVLTVGGGLGAIDALLGRLAWNQPWRGAAVVLSVVVLSAAIDLPMSIWRTFRIEAQFGFNRMSPALFVADLARNALLGLLIGGPVVLGAITLMDRAGALWWIWAWGAWLGLMLLMTWAWPAFIAPLFNRFSKLDDPSLESRISSLLERCGFKSQGVFVVDGSRRSAHGNAYFTGIGRHKRIVFFDTLLSRLEHSEVEAVLAHELGHFRLHHVRKRLLVTMAGSLAALALLGWLAAQPSFYTMLIVPVFTFFATPLGSLWSRRHEFEADAFAARFASAAELVTALVKLYRDNATTLTPDRLYSAFYYSHPPALERIARLRRPAPLGGPGPAAQSAV